MRGVVLSLATAAVAAPTAALAVMPINIADYDCTRSDDNRTVPGADLVGQGFQIQSAGRFGQAPNVMMVDPKTQVRANCFRRQGGPK